MTQVQYITREFIPRVDLTTLGNTFNTLEQGHQAAVQAASDLKATIATLPMDAQEDGFKEKLVNEINQTVDDNTLYGNSYGALDNLVEQIGNIQSDGRVIGRVRNHQAKVQYDAKVDSMAIPDGMKQMYKEENPYYYEDGEVDVNTGRVLPGEMWKAKTNPVTTVPETEIQRYALQIAAKDAGSGEAVSFLDVNGKPTPDPMQSADGAIYKQVGTKWERLSEDKIREAYRVAIDSIPGAKDSINQDYRYATWQYDKLVEDAEAKGGDTTPYVKGYTDKNGNVYTKDQWLNNKINNFADVAAYNHVYSSVNYGTALQNKKARESGQGSGAGIGAGGINLFNGERAVSKGIVGYEEVETNAFADAANSKNAANNTVLSLVRKYMPNSFKSADSVTDLIRMTKVSGPGNLANYIVKHSKGMTKEDAIRLRNAAFAYVTSNKQYNNFIKSAKNKNQIDALRFSQDVANGIITSNSTYGKAIINQKNKLFRDGRGVDYNVGKDVLDAYLKNKNTTIAKMRRQGFNITTDENDIYHIVFTGNNRDLVEAFDADIEKANNDVGGSFGGWLKKAFTGEASSGNYVIKSYNVPKSQSQGEPLARLNVIRQIYKYGTDEASKAEKTLGVTKGKRTFNSYANGSFGSMFYQSNGDNFSPNELNTLMEQADTDVDNLIASGNLDSGRLLDIDNTGNVSHNISHAQDAKSILQDLYRNEEAKKHVVRNTVITKDANGLHKGYVFSFTVPEGYGNDTYKEGKSYRIIQDGTIEESIQYDPSQNAAYIARNNVSAAKATGGNVENIGYHNDLGNTDIIQNRNGTFTTTLFGKAKNITDDEAAYLSADIYRLQELKARYRDNIGTKDTIVQAQINNAAAVLANDLAVRMGINYNTAANCVANYLQSNDD